jgi:hypothetical protein
LTKTEIENLKERVNQLDENQGSSLWLQVLTELTPQERTNMRGFLNAMKHAHWPDNFDFETQLKYALSGLVSEAEHDAMLKAWTQYRTLIRDRVGLEVKTESITKLLDLLKSEPCQDNFSSRRLVIEMKEAVEYLTKTHGADCLTDQYGKDYSSSILELIRKAESGNYANADDFIRQFNEDEQIALARLIYAVEKSGIARNPLRSAFSQAFRAKST